MILTLEELKKIFPQHKRVNSEELNKLLDGLHDNCSKYQDIYGYFTDFIKESFLGPNFKEIPIDEQVKSEMDDYLYDYRTDRLTYSAWVELVEDRFIVQRLIMGLLKQNAKVVENEATNSDDVND